MRMLCLFCPLLLSVGAFFIRLCCVCTVCILEADLVDSFNPGDDVVIVGTVVRRWRPLCAGSRCQVQCSIRANRFVLLVPPIVDFLCLKVANVYSV